MMTGLPMAFFIFGKKEWHIRDIRKVKKRQHQFFSSVIHRVRLKKNLQKDTFSIQWGETQETILTFTLSFFFSRAPPLLLHRFSLILPVQPL
jgi:hypothetical protein